MANFYNLLKLLQVKCGSEFLHSGFIKIFRSAENSRKLNGCGSFVTAETTGKKDKKGKNSE
ncbi:MAG: hypothetical protein GY749_44635 [Desulfobacteraceae bacterium]|nr:hypothetical protein [Desulfobacteraceae bacterium]